MKHLKTRILIFIVFSIFFYLMGSFVQVSFDINKWALASRVLVGVFGNFLAVLFALHPVDDMLEKE